MLGGDIESSSAVRLMFVCPGSFSSRSLTFFGERRVTSLIESSLQIGDGNPIRNRIGESTDLLERSRGNVDERARGVEEDPTRQHFVMKNPRLRR